MRNDLEQLADAAAEQATECSQRGDTEGSFYARGLRDAYRTIAAFADVTPMCDDESPSDSGREPRVQEKRPGSSCRQVDLGTDSAGSTPGPFSLSTPPQDQWRMAQEEARTSTSPIALRRGIRWVLVESFGGEGPYLTDVDFASRVHAAEKMVARLVELHEQARLSDA